MKSLMLAALLVQDPPKIEKSEKAPETAAKNQDGKEVKLADFKDKKNVLLAFYPKDATPGWTKEMQTLRDSIKTYEDAGTVVLGVSMDDAESHKKFCEDQKLPFDLLVDTDKKMHTAYGFKGMVRALILIDRKGVIQFVNKEFKLKKEQWEDLAKAVESLKEEKK